MTASRFVAPMRCAACQRFVLEQLTGLSLRRSTILRHHQARRPLLQPRKIHAASRSQANAVSRLGEDGSEVERRTLDDAYETLSEENVEDGPPPTDTQVEPATPWYLRNTESSSEINPFAHKQRLPALPENPPPVLEPLLNHLSVDIGLDYLNLIDLRDVDPPPAFGANLYMIFGTARSEKHLNVSADRLCRWLRSEYKLTPYADGLLGRQELKLKLRRKARRAKMLGAAGASNASSLQLDDGTRTGWVCVSVGDVEAPADSADPEVADKGFVGFGARSNTAKIVIQMLIEEKRVELDLENLWQGILKGSVRRKHETESETTPTPTPYPNNSERSGHINVTRSLAKGQQTRAFHSSARTLDVGMASMDDQNWAESSIDGDWLDNSASRLTIMDTDLVSDLAELRELLRRESPVRVLGKDEYDHSSTDFLQRFFRRMPPFRSLDHWNAHIMLHRLGMDAGHGGYTSEYQWKLLKNMDDSCIAIPIQTFVFVIENIMRKKSGWGESVPSVKAEHYRTNTGETHNLSHLQTYSPLFATVEKHLHMAFDTLERMESHRHAPLPLDFFLNLHASISKQPEQVTARERGELQLRYYESLKLSFPVDEPLPQLLVLDMLRTWARQNSWRNFWTLWRDIALTGFRRDEHMYAVVFESIGRRHDQPVSRRVIAELVPEMGKEKPAVEIDDKIALGILRCLRNLGFHPQGEEGLVKLYGSLWDKCWALVDPKYEALPHLYE